LLKLKSRLIFVTAKIVTLLLVIGLVVPGDLIHAERTVNGYSYSDEQIKVLDDINQLRKSLGLPQVTLDADLTVAAVGHSKYLFANDEITHVQTKSLLATQKSFTDRLKAAAGENFFNKKGWTSVSEGIAYRSPQYAVQDLVEVPYHRVSIIQPNLTHIGVGTTGYHNTVIDYGSSGEYDYSKQPILYPYSGQEDVPLSQKVTETPDPFEGTGLVQSDAGFILSISTGVNVQKKDLSISLTNDKGKDVPYVLRNQSNSESASFWIVIPVKKLDEQKQYTLKVNSSTSTFTTMSESKYQSLLVAREPEYKAYRLLDSNEQKKVLANSKLPSKEAAGNTNSASIVLDGTKLSITPSARIYNGSTFIPLRGVLESMGAKVNWAQKEKKITITKDATEIVLYVDQKQVIVKESGQKEKTITLDKAPFVDNGYTFIPLRFISEALGAKVVWEQSSYTVNITS